MRRRTKADRRAGKARMTVIHAVARREEVCYALFAMTEVDTAIEREEESPELRIYELGFHIAPTVPEEKVGTEVSAVRNVLEKEGVQTIAEEFPKLRTLAYPLRVRASGRHLMHTSAYFGWIKFETAAEAVRRLESALKGFSNIIRFIVVKTVREQTMTMPRAPRTEIKHTRREVPHADVGKPPSEPVSEAELEKSLEKLIAE